MMETKEKEGIKKERKKPLNTLASLYAIFIYLFFFLFFFFAFVLYEAMFFAGITRSRVNDATLQYAQSLGLTLLRGVA